MTRLDVRQPLGVAATIAPTGLTGATTASRYVGATASGPPASGTFSIGDYVVDLTGGIWVCTTAGSPGTWTPVGVPGLLLAPSNFISAGGNAVLAANAAGGNRSSGITCTNTGASEVQTAFYVPAGWSAVNIVLYWCNGGAGSGNVVWGSLLHSFAAGVTINAGDSTTSTTATAGAQDVLVKTTIDFARAVTGGGYARLRLQRITGGSDTLGNGAVILAVYIGPAAS